MARRKQAQPKEPPMEWDAEEEARELAIAMSRQREWTAKDEVEFEKWLDSLPQPTDDEIAEFESKYLDSWERQAYVYGRR